MKNETHPQDKHDAPWLAVCRTSHVSYPQGDHESHRYPGSPKYCRLSLAHTLLPTPHIYPQSIVEQNVGTSSEADSMPAGHVPFRKILNKTSTPLEMDADRFHCDFVVCLNGTINIDIGMDSSSG
jgi:hypothetical protein